ncbi:MOG interacting and ectopic P-granules protein 1 [Parasteatoda tepidariorum]|uniref:MOG interacting and ectopic P-granules protein 1 n=1 Tax=Parasteatoda tepidariorum TaxID=114398 RepID=UPI00077FE2DD|nr:MOG interacting and ectopic P-granules protein 1 [Parasteatoda tepidariorum]XP_015912811.1 MOG interacting and ectopic P-granules protein 1 [Parasteatoda tepidariorum]
MTSVVNGKTHEGDLNSGSDKKTFLKDENEEVDGMTKTKSEINNFETQNIKDQSCVDSMSDPEKKIDSSISNELDSSVKLGVDTPKENGIHSSGLSDEANFCSSKKGEAEKESNKNCEEIEVKEVSCTSDVTESNNHDSSNLDKDVKDSISNDCEKKENGLQDESLNKSTNESLNKKDNEIESECHKTSDELSKNDKTDKFDSTVKKSKLDVKNAIATEIPDLSVPKDKDAEETPVSKDKDAEETPVSKDTDAEETPVSKDKDAEETPVSKDKDAEERPLVNGFVEPNPLEKLNEHLNSIGCDEISKGLQNIHQKSSTVKLSQKSDDQSSNKENKNIASHAHDRFKESPDNFVFAELTNEDTGFPEIFTGLVKIGRYISVKGDFTLRSTEALVESPSLVSSYLLKEPDIFPPKEKDSKSESKDFFHTSAGEILIGIGLSRVNEWYHKDMVRVKKRQMKREGKRPQTEEELANHEKSYIEAKKANNVYSCEYKVCKTCGFTTESSVVMEGHLLVPHLTQRKEYQCNFCEVINRDPRLMLEHMEQVHKKIGRIQPPVLFFECPYCTFESNSKVKLNNHLTKCQRYFDHGVNQAPPRDFDFPALTPKPITVAVVKAYEKSLGSMHRGRGRPKKHENMTDSMSMNQISPIVSHPHSAPNNFPNYKSSSSTPLNNSLGSHNQIMSPMQMSNLNIRPAHSNSMSQIRSSVSPMVQTPNRIYQVLNSAGQVVPIVGSNQVPTTPNQFPFASNTVNSGKKLHNTGPFFNSSPFGSGLHQQNLAKNMPELNALPKMTGPYPLPAAKQSNQPGNVTMNSNNLVVCEICDGYIKDLDQLRTHMQLIHKVKIHPKMLVSRPPLNCQKCQWRFFTDQGLERHLLGAHGLVTSNMQELANKNKDAGCCTICGRVYASKLVSHMNQIHKVTLKPAHLSYKCTVCSATFNLYRLFENHVYLVHSGAAKRSSEGGRSSPSKKHKTSSDLEKSAAEESRDHRDKKQSKESLEVRICVECGDDVYSSNPDSKKCEKCLKSDELIQGTLSSKANQDELKKNKMKKAAS